MIATVTTTLKSKLFRRILLSVLLLVVALGSAAVTTLVASHWRNSFGIDNTLTTAGAESGGLSAREHYLRQQVQHLVMAVVAPDDFRVVVSLTPIHADFSSSPGMPVPDSSSDHLALAPPDTGEPGGDHLASESQLSRHVLILVDNTVVAAATVDQVYRLVYQGLGLEAEGRDALQIDALPFIQFDWAVALRDRHLWTVFLATFWFVLLAGVLAAIPWWRLRGPGLAGDGRLYQDELRRLRYIATDEPARVANVLADWLRGESD